MKIAIEIAMNFKSTVKAMVRDRDEIYTLLVTANVVPDIKSLARLTCYVNLTTRPSTGRGRIQQRHVRSPRPLMVHR